MATLNLKKKKFIDEDALKKIVAIGINFGERLNSIESKCIASYDETHSYLKDELCIYDNYIYKCNSTATGTWNPDRWTLIGDDITELTLDEIKAMLGLTQEQLNTLASIILDNEIRLDKTWSSSKSHTEIQETLKEAKQYCLTELAKKSTSSFKKASSTAEVTDGNYLYLIMNDDTSKYDIYALVDGNVELLTSVDVNLDDYFTKAEIDNDFLKKTDATSTYATKIELGDKVDKTDIVDNLTSIDTNKPLSANQGKILDDKKLNKTDITTTIDSSSTDEQVPSALTVFNAISKLLECKKNTTDLDIDIYEEPFTAHVNIESGILGTFPNGVKWGTIIQLPMKNYRCQMFLAINKMYYRIMNNKVWSKWKKVCTTSVEDVPNTQISTNDAFTSTNDIQYSVSNGMCTLKVEATGISYTTDINYSWVKVTDDILPMPKMGIKFPLVCMPSGKSVVCTIDRNKKNLKVRGTIPSGTVEIYGSVSYPVAES